jgi:hypothetical protein
MDPTDPFSFFGGATSSPEFQKTMHSLAEEAAARRGECPEPRVCDSKQELSRWFRLCGVAAGAIARIGKGAKS